MKRLFISVVVGLLLFTSCQATTPSITEVEKPSKKLAETIDESVTLQLITNGPNKAYIVFQTENDVNADILGEDNTVSIHLNKINTENDDVQQHIYYIKKPSEYETIQVFVDGEETYFNQATSL